MYAIELSGVHLNKVLKVRYQMRNKDGSVRKNATTHEWYMIFRRIEHEPDGQIRYAGYASTDMFKVAPDDWLNNRIMGTYVHNNKWNIENTGVNHNLLNIPYYAEVEVIED